MCGPQLKFFLTELILFLCPTLTLTNKSQPYMGSGEAATSHFLPSHFDWSLLLKETVSFSEDHDRPGVAGSWLRSCFGCVAIRRRVWEINFGNEACGTYFHFDFFPLQLTFQFARLPKFRHDHLRKNSPKWLTTVCGSVGRPHSA